MVRNSFGISVDKDKLHKSMLAALQPERRMMSLGMPLNVYICRNITLCSEQIVMK